MNVGELVDQLMGAEDGEVNFEKEIIPAEALVAVVLPDGTIITLNKIEYEPHKDAVLSGTLWLKGEYF